MALSTGLPRGDRQQEWSSSYLHSRHVLSRSRKATEGTVSFRTWVMSRTGIATVGLLLSLLTFKRLKTVIISE